MSWLSQILARFKAASKPAKPTKHVPVTGLKFTSQVLPIASFSEFDVVALHNAERARLGLHPLEPDVGLSNFAAARASHAASVALPIEHVHDGFAGILGPSKSAENAAMGQVDAASVVADWMSSPGHRANILDPAFGLMGAGRATSADKVTYWYTCFVG